MIHLGLRVEAQEVVSLPDIRLISLRKRRNLRFLTGVLQQRWIAYYWGFLFKLIIDYNNQWMVIRNKPEGEEFIQKMDY